MKFDIDRDNLHSTLALAAGAVQRSGPGPQVLSHVLLDVDDGRLAISGTDTEVSISATTDVEMLDAGSITVPARKLLDIARSLPSGAVVRIALDGEQVIVSSGRSRFKLSTLPPHEFPNSGDVDEASEITIPGTDLASVIERVHFAMGNNDQRHFLNGILTAIEDGRLRAVATDGHRLGLADAACEDAGGTAQGIVPRKAVLEITRLLKAVGGDAKFSLGKSGCSLKVGRVHLVSRLIDGRFPDYEAVVPAINGSGIVVDRSELQAALTRVSVLADNKANGVSLSLSGDSLRLASKNGNEDGADEIAAEHEQDTLRVGFNIHYLQDAAGAIAGDTLRIQAKDSGSACLITDAAGDQQTRQVVMPVKL